MNIEFKTIKVITPDNKKCLKISQNGKVLMYITTPYYDLPNYNYTIEEIPIEEAEKDIKQSNTSINKLIKKLKFIFN